MKIDLKNIKIKDLVDKYADNGEDGVVGYGGSLQIRPPYQREFVYGVKERNKVIDTIIKKFPLNTIYWVDNGNNNYEVLDGQQRIISICQYFVGDFSVKDLNNKVKYFHGLSEDRKNEFLNYELFVYFCQGTDDEKLEWFKTINIAGIKLTEQELRNAVYTGRWLTDAKKYFSKRSCPASHLAKKYMNGSANRQEFLETAIKWISNRKIEEYMSSHQNNLDSEELRLYFEKVIEWVNNLFPKYREEMKGVEWGLHYNNYKNKNFDSNKLEKQVNKLMLDEDVTKKSGIYPYLITGNEKHLNIRTFSKKIKSEVFEKQGGYCPKCGKSKKYTLEEMEADHITPWSEGGETKAENCQMLCKRHNREKSNK